SKTSEETTSTWPTLFANAARMFLVIRSSAKPLGPTAAIEGCRGSTTVDEDLKPNLNSVISRTSKGQTEVEPTANLGAETRRRMTSQSSSRPFLSITIMQTTKTAKPPIR